MRPPVALIQRSVPHYRLPLFLTLQNDPRFDWTFYSGQHSEREGSGLPVSLEELNWRAVRQFRLPANLVFQAGVPLARARPAAIVTDYGWNIVSNPIRFIRAKTLGIATIGWSKGISQQLDRTKSAARRGAEFASISLCDALIVYGRTSRDYFLDLGVPHERIFVAQNTIDTEAIAAATSAARIKSQSLRAQLGFDLQQPVVGFLGKISRAKRVDVLIEAFEMARDQGMRAQLLIAGTGPLNSEIASQMKCSRYAADMVRLDAVPPGQEGTILQLMDLYATFAEPGLGVLEAMASSVPILSTPGLYPETELLAAGRTAFISFDASIRSFAHSMATAIADGDARHRVAESALKDVLSSATLDNMANAICEAVRYALHLRPAPRHLVPPPTSN